MLGLRHSISDYSLIAYGCETTDQSSVEGIPIWYCETRSALFDALRQKRANAVILCSTKTTRVDPRFIDQIVRKAPHVHVYIACQRRDIAAVVNFARAGVTEVLPDSPTLLNDVVSRLRNRQQTLNPFSSIITQDDSLLREIEGARAVAGSQVPVLITGETGTGKELFARAIHYAGGRSGSYVAENVAGLDDTLFSDVVFGHRRGAFTGANNNRDGRVVSAEGGTFFMDEIGDLSSQSQVKLLRLLDNRQFYALGSSVPTECDVQFVFATHHDFHELVRTGQFREDLYYRISYHKVQIPPLRDRPGDIAPLAEHFLRVAAGDLDLPIPKISPDAIRMLQRRSWPGNVRELRSAILNALLVTYDGEITVESFEEPVQKALRKHPHSEKPEIFFSGPLPELESLSLQLTIEAMRRSSGNQTAAASLLGISPSAVSKRMLRARTVLDGMNRVTGSSPLNHRY